MTGLAPNLHFHDLHPPPEDFRAQVLVGLSARPRQLSPKFFYDGRGSQLFEAITRLPEYYPTRTEIALLRQHGREMARALGDGCLLFELGCGSDTKIRVLLDALQPKVYAPIDIAREALLQGAAAIARDHRALQVHAICADYSQPFALPDLPAHPRAAFFPGSSIGNFDPPAARELLGHIRRWLGPQGKLLIGVDLKKSPDVLHTAYDDAQGVTAEFNRNLLVRINRELGANFDVNEFEHVARYDARHARVEMHLVARSAQRVTLADRNFDFAAGEGIHTENSYKFSVAEFRALAAQAGLVSVDTWQDGAGLFSLHCLTPG